VTTELTRVALDRTEPLKNSSKKIYDKNLKRSEKASRDKTDASERKISRDKNHLSGPSVIAWRETRVVYCLATQRRLKHSNPLFSLQKTVMKVAIAYLYFLAISEVATLKFELCRIGWKIPI